MSVKKAKVHLISGFLGTGKTTALRSLMAQKNPDEKWVIVVNEFGEIGIDGAVLSDEGIPVAEIAGGCLCCVGGAQMGDTLQKMLAVEMPDRIMIEASGLAHAAGVIDELKAEPFRDKLEIAAVLTVVDPRQFVDPDYALQPLYKDQIGVCDVLVAGKTDLCAPEVLAEFRDKAAALFPPKTAIIETQQGALDIACLDLPVAEKPRYRLKTLPDNTMGFQSQGYTFAAGRDFDGERLTAFFNRLPELTEGLVRAKGVFQVLGTWVWLNWVDGQWGASQVSWRRDSRFELIAKSFDADRIEAELNAALETPEEAAAFTQRG
ncbi:MAG: GTP-binding protein [Neisseria sp.]|nr:GTP-binding protein [Neisseria sp.]